MDRDQLTLGMVMRRARTTFAGRRIISRTGAGRVEYRYDEFFARVDRLAVALQRLGVRTGDRVATLAWNHHRHLELYAAVTLSGAVLHTVNIRLAPAQALGTIRHAGDRVVFVDGDLGEHLAALQGAEPGLPLVRLDGSDPLPAGVLDYETLLAESADAPPRYPELTETMPAATSYSSATTGDPKGVVYSHRALTLHSMMLAMTDTWGISEADTVLPVVPMFHVNAWGLPFVALWMGSRIVLPGPRPTGVDIHRLLVEEEVTFSAAVPTVWMDVLDTIESGAEVPRSLRRVVSGGAALPRALLQQADRLGVPLAHAYGMTEASPVVLVGEMRSDAPEGADRLDLRLRQGYVVPGLEYEVRDSAGEPVPWDGRTSGELFLRGPWVAEEYERDERTAATFRDGWYASGDIVTIDPAGYVQVVDRVADLIKSGGEWISSLVLEDALMTHPAVARAAVVAVPDERWQERPLAYVVASEEVSAEELREHLDGSVPRFWVPDEFVLVPEIPVTSVGKFDKRAMRARRREGRADQE